MRTLALSGMIIGASILVGCGSADMSDTRSDTGSVEQTLNYCNFNSDCLSGTTCVNGFCYPVCSVVGATCYSGTCWPENHMCDGNVSEFYCRGTHMPDEVCYP